MIVNRKKTVTRPFFRQRPLNRVQKKQVLSIIERNKKTKRKHNNFSVSVTSTVQIFEITSIAEGDNFDTRDSDKILCMSLKAHLSAAAVSGPQRIRFGIVVSKAGPLSASDFPAYLSVINRDKMWVIRDIYGELSVEQPMNVNVFHRFKRKRVKGVYTYYDDTISATAALKNAMYVFVVTNVAMDGPAFSGFTELVFQDAD
jgi:hypothetical protein